MNKILKIALLMLSVIGLSSCGNKEVGFGSYTFTKVHIQMYGGDTVHLEVKRWISDDGGVELKTENFGNIILGDGTYMLYDLDECPLCGKVKYK